MRGGTDIENKAALLRARFSGLSGDSRKAKTGDLFVAVPGVAVDGARFIRDAAGKGVRAVLGRPEAEAFAREVGLEFVACDNPRLMLAKLSAAYYGTGPHVKAAVTGTNGKTSIAVFLREIWTALGKNAASVGTIGAISRAGEIKLSNTTPGPLELHTLLADLAKAGVSHVAVEASSHGLDQYRLDGLCFGAVGFTNITRDHLDYHSSFEAYLAAKLRLFSDLAEDGAAAAINRDAEYAEAFADVADARHLRVIGVGEKGETIRLLACQPHLDGQDLRLRFYGRKYSVALPLAGGFQAANALMAAGMAIGLDEPADAVFAALEGLKGAPGRLEKVAIAPSGAPVFVDYAHTPDALEVVLKALRPHTGGRLIVVFGCGGDRDKGKRPLMGKAAAALADAVIVTDDNPRSEEPSVIRREVLAGCPDATEIGDRHEAIRAGIELLQAGDILVIAGKGHESGQIVGKNVFPFSDRDEAIEAARALGGAAAGQS
jgi:UDP-N-acetylmuramoyl-L-alanyl-D-glutamate--2,6-diaminopimelate ligase